MVDFGCTNLQKKWFKGSRICIALGSIIAATRLVSDLLYYVISILLARLLVIAVSGTAGFIGFFTKIILYIVYISLTELL